MISKVFFRTKRFINKTKLDSLKHGERTPLLTFQSPLDCAMTTLAKPLKTSKKSRSYRFFSLLLLSSVSALLIHSVLIRETVDVLDSQVYCHHFRVSLNATQDESPFLTRLFTTSDILY
ncbi:hypothetical protein AVEN_153759-1 [Araneus ventricosus]|uniref:Uncharacterized protein n=1 Tax=Araneus ventricosus TaxID=182803 RepID=A0A4Y2KTQ0_ARAVE|nr:hypothetical protein AVEN_153759-1 [Araneus ventricosus]